MDNKMNSRNDLMCSVKKINDNKDASGKYINDLYSVNMGSKKYEITEVENSEASSQDGEEVAYEDQPVSHTPKRGKESSNGNTSPDKANYNIDIALDVQDAANYEDEDDNQNEELISNMFLGLLILNPQQYLKSISSQLSSRKSSVDKNEVKYQDQDLTTTQNSILTKSNENDQNEVIIHQLKDSAL